jgi:hypothetical protein
MKPRGIERNPEALQPISVNKDDILKITALDKDQLYSFLGVQVLGTDTSPTKTLFSDELKAVQTRSQIRIGFPDSEQRGRGWLKNNINAIKPFVKKTLCDDLHYCTNEKEIHKDLAVVVTAIVPLIPTGLGIPALTVVTIVVLLVKYYGRVLCKCPESSSGEN